MASTESCAGMPSSARSGSSERGDGSDVPPQWHKYGGGNEECYRRHRRRRTYVSAATPIPIPSSEPLTGIPGPWSAQKPPPASPPAFVYSVQKSFTLAGTTHERGPKIPVLPVSSKAATPTAYWTPSKMPAPPSAKFVTTYMLVVFPPVWPQR